MKNRPKLNLFLVIAVLGSLMLEYLPRSASASTPTPAIEITNPRSYQPRS